VVDIGIVCSDLERSSRFYREVLGLEEIPGFTGAAQVTGDSGLCDYRDVPVRQFVVPGGGGTTIKLMAFPSPAPRPAAVDQRHLESSLGLRYLTLIVKDVEACRHRLAKNGVSFLAKGPVAIPGTPLFLAVVKDPDGNFVELVGPRP
jgi:catechol 2,3-dioxygenase-like lactoylglutathione lyase family enzyme